MDQPKKHQDNYTNFNKHRTNLKPKITTRTWREKVASACLVILGLGHGATAHAQETVSYGTAGATPKTTFCNDRGYVEREKEIHDMGALHCKTGEDKKTTVNKNDIVFTKVSTTPV